MGHIQFIARTLREIFEKDGSSSYLYLANRLTKEDLKEMGVDMPGENQEYILTEKVPCTITEGMNFDVMFSLMEPTNNIKVRTTVKGIWVGRGRQIKTLTGYNTAEALIEFEGGKPDMMIKLNYFGNFDPQKQRGLIISTQKVLDKLLEKL